MRGFNRIGCALLMVILVAGCGKEDAPGTSGASYDATNAADDADGGLRTAQDQVDGVTDRANDAIEKGKDQADGAAAAVTANANALLEKAMQYIKDNKLDLAQGALSKLDGIKAPLPAGLQQKISDAKSALDAAKTAQDAKSTLDDAGALGKEVKKAIPGLSK